MSRAVIAGCTVLTGLLCLLVTIVMDGSSLETWLAFPTGVAAFLVVHVAIEKMFGGAP